MFWDQFIKLCDEHEISPNPLGRKLGISSGIFSRWKTGAMPSTEMLIKLSQYFDVSIDYLLFGDQAMNGRQSFSKGDALIITDQNERLLIKHYRALYYVKQIQFLSSVITEAEKESKTQ